MLFTSLLSLLALSALVRSAPTPAELEERGSKYHCVTKYSGKLSGKHKGKPFPFTRSGNLVTYSGDNPKSNILHVEFQACTNTTTGKIMQEADYWIGRLRVKNTNSCIQLIGHKGVMSMAGSPKIVQCNSKKLTDAETWMYVTYERERLIWAGWLYYGYDNPVDGGGDECLGGYRHVDDGKPRVASKKQIKMDCGREFEDWVRFLEIL